MTTPPNAPCDTQIAVAIFAGGQSRRMGRDKADLTINGETLLERAARTALEVSPRVFVVGRAVPQNWPLPEVEFIPDDEPNLGPLGALQTTLRRENEVLAVACDLPKIGADSLRWLLAQPRGECGVVVDNNGQLEPLFAIYRAACLPLIEENRSAGRRSLHALIQRGKFHIVSAPLEIQSQLHNVNTPDEWRAFNYDSAL
jgi:molybdenum cofactor guanylyltransferase